MISDILNDFEKLLFIAIAFTIFADLITSFVLFMMSKQFVSNSTTVKAKITKLEVFNNTQKATISFKDNIGSTIQTTLLIPSMKYLEGQEIEVLSHKNNPSKVKLNTFASLWMLPSIVAMFAVMMVIMLIALLAMGVAELPF